MDEVMGFIGMDLGYVEEDFARQQRTLNRLISRSKIMADWADDRLWQLFEVSAKSGRDKLLAACRHLTKEKVPTLCWATDESCHGKAYLLAIYSHANDTPETLTIQSVLKTLKVVDTYAGKVRLEEVARDPFAWSFQFANFDLA